MRNLTKGCFQLSYVIFLNLTLLLFSQESFRQRFCNNNATTATSLSFQKLILSFNTSFKLYLSFFLILTSSLVFGQNAALEFASGNENPTGNGPVIFSVIRFRNKTNNPTGTTFATYNPALNVTATLSNQQYNYVGITPNASVVFGYANAVSPIFPLFNAFGVHADADYTASGAVVGQGINVANNSAIEVQSITTPLRVAGIPTNQRVRMADLTLTFNRPVNNPNFAYCRMG
ncbi:hypothetical protein QLS31_12080 [Flavobacterium sp. XS2P24]|uniref:hypothetical protein n=1 Tax=Flavobacterium sp. XS2P24 TaxID=3041249 RepID=UPI0024A9513B|nr:hypothetical protein [Flavobacterium sp. XS2P24]MDI6050570.1 hypothetical protein [Flavobacterium sp. XS2P24]